MRIVLKIVLIVLGILFSLLSVFLILIMRSRRDDDHKEYTRLQRDNTIWLAVFLLLAAACFWGSSRF